MPQPSDKGPPLEDVPVGESKEDALLRTLKVRIAKSKKAGNEKPPSQAQIDYLLSRGYTDIPETGWEMRRFIIASRQWSR